MAAGTAGEDIARIKRNVLCLERMCCHLIATAVRLLFGHAALALVNRDGGRVGFIGENRRRTVQYLLDAMCVETN